MRRLDNFSVVKLKVFPVEHIRTERERQVCVARATDRSLLRPLEPTVGIVFEFLENNALAPRVRVSIKHRRVRRIRPSAQGIPGVTRCR